jgi:hypothetical protein
MTEISKFYKIILIVNIVVSFVYGTLFAFFWWFWLPTIDYTASSPFYAQFFGGLLLVSMIWFLRILLQKMSWEKAVIFIEYTIAVLAIMLAYLIYEMIAIDLSPTAQVNQIVSTSLTGILLAGNVAFFVKERVKQK